VSRAHADAIEALASWTAPNDRQEALRRAYVAHLTAHPDGLDRSCRPDHVTASTLVLSPDGERVLLTLHRKARAWFQLGGHVEPTDAALAAAALREATEESGLDGLSLDPVPVHLDAHRVPFCGGEGSRHLDVRFVAVAPEGAAGTAGQAVSTESLDLRWWPVGELPTEERSLRELVDLGRKRLRG